MKKKSKIGFKNIIFYILFALLLIGAHYVLATTGGQKMEGIVESKHVKKGLYLYPRYEIVVLDRNKPSNVSKEAYHSLEVGDKVSGYIRDDGRFVTDYHIKREKIIMTSILIFLYLCLFVIVVGSIQESKFIKKYKTLHNFLTRFFNRLPAALFAVWMIAGAVMVSIVFTNLYHKLNTSQLVETEAVVEGFDTKALVRFRGAFIIYELELAYEDEDAKVHKVKKSVTGTTYLSHLVNDEVTINYRKDNVDDVFLQPEKFREVWGTIISPIVFLVVVYFLSVYLIIRKWREKRQKKKAGKANT